MGMFDYVRCEYPLPDGFDGSGTPFQTKDTDAQLLETYTITSSGLLLDESERVVPFHGDLNFYWSNISGSCARGVITEDNSPVVYRYYTALYDHGKLLKMEGESRVDTEAKVITRQEFFAV